jgi:hypothetical protein
MRKPLMNVRYATDNFNWLNRLNHRAAIAKLNRDGRAVEKAYTNYKDVHGLWRDWKPECEYYCSPCIAEKVKTKLFNRNPINDTFKKVFCIASLVVLTGYSPTDAGLKQNKI